MNPILKNILAVAAGVIVGMAVNMGLITLSPYIISPPSGVDVSDMESLKANMHLFEAKHFIMPFLAHSLGTLAGAFVAAMIAAGRKMTFALVIGVFFLLGGITAVTMLSAPVWYNVLDLVVAYIPMGYLGGKLALGGQSAV